MNPTLIILIILNLTNTCQPSFFFKKPLTINDLQAGDASKIDIKDLGTYLYWKMEYTEKFWSYTPTEQNANSLGIGIVWEKFQSDKERLKSYLEYAKNVSKLKLTSENPVTATEILEAGQSQSGTPDIQENTNSIPNTDAPGLTKSIQQKLFNELISLKYASNEVTGMLSDDKAYKVSTIINTLYKNGYRLTPASLTTLSIPDRALDNIKDKLKCEPKYFSKSDIKIMVDYYAIGENSYRQEDRMNYLKLREHFKAAFIRFIDVLKKDIITGHEHKWLTSQSYAGWRTGGRLPIHRMIDILEGLKDYFRINKDHEYKKFITPIEISEALLYFNNFMPGINRAYRDQMSGVPGLDKVIFDTYLLPKPVKR